MDPATVLGKVAASAGPSLTKEAVRRWRLSGVVEPKWLQLDATEGLADLTATEVADVNAFLESPKSRPLLLVQAASRLLGEGNDLTLNNTLVRAFEDEATAWCVERGQGWNKAAPAIWNRLREVLGFVMPEPATMGPFTAELDNFAAFIRTPLEHASPENGAEFFVARLLELAGDLGRALAAVEVAQAAVVLERGRTLPPIIAHAEVENRPTFERLYVARTLYNPADGSEIASEELALGGRPFRVVLLGNPGAGKSTFVRHLSHEIARPDQTGAGQASVIVRCREYLKLGHASEPLVDFVTGLLRISGVPGATTEAVSDALLLGQVAVIFDGLDEISDAAQRSEMSSQIESFAMLYPLASILVTSRVVGYNRAGISPSQFKHLSLREFTDEQIVEYVERWFTEQNERGLISPFVRESETVLDLRRSPLLLSLLCILYRARGHLPRRRREVYSRCADLLFHTWDSRRQIEQPDEMPHYGDRLMQEIARWVYESSTAQAGIPEAALLGVIAVYLEGVGIQRDEARLRAREFLEFCAGRAWLLGPIGTNDFGERLFGFTHRTFFEFFAAEAYARMNKGAESICDAIERAFKRDATSVLPELLIQSHDAHADRGAMEVFKLLCGRRSVSAGLILRLMNGSLLSAHTRKTGFFVLLEGWRRDKTSVGREAFDALFTLEPNALSQFVNDYMRDSPTARNMFAHGWAAAVLSRREHYFPEEVATIARDVVAKLIEDKVWLDDLVVYNWLVATGDLPIPADELFSFLVVGASSGPIPGAVPFTLAKWLSDRGSANVDVTVELLSTWFDSLEEPGSIPDDLATRMVQVADPVIFSALDSEIHTYLSSLEEVERAVVKAMIAMAMVNFEAGLWRSSYRLEGGGVADFVTVRRWKKFGGEPPSYDCRQRAIVLGSQLPKWCREWALDIHHLVAPIGTAWLR